MKNDRTFLFSLRGFNLHIEHLEHSHEMNEKYKMQYVEIERLRVLTLIEGIN